MVVPLSTIERNQAMANALQAQSLQFRPIAHPLQGLAQLAQAASGMILSRRADRQEKERQAAANQALASLASAGTPSLPSLLQLSTQFPELSGTVQPLIAAQFTPTKGVVVGPGGRLTNPVTGAVIAETPAVPKRPVLREIADATSPTGTRLVTVEEAVGAAGPPRQEFRMETITDPGGGTRTIMVRGRPGGTSAEAPVSKPTQSKLEQGITTATNQLDRLGQIRENLDESFLNLPEQIKQGGLALAERMGITLSPEQRSDLTKFTRFRTSTLRNLNRLLNELSGAAISPAEAKRLQAELPTTDDSPSQFIAKIQDAEEAVQAAITRNQQLLESGVESLEFDKRGEIVGAPELEIFMLLEEERGTVEAGMAPTDLSGVSDDELLEMLAR